MKTKSFSLLISLLFAVAGIRGAEEPKELPSWVLFGQARELVGQKHFGEAVVLYRQAIVRKGIFPEAQVDPVIQIANMVTRQGS